MPPVTNRARAPPLSSVTPVSRARRHGLLWELLTFERLLTQPLTHLVYWAGLALISLVAFGAVGAAVGLWIRSGWGEGLLLALPTVIIGLLLAGALALIWRSCCEFFVAVFSIAEDLRALRLSDEADRRAPPPAPAAPPRAPDAGWSSAARDLR